MSKSTALVIALVASVAINLLILGVVIGRNTASNPKAERAPMEWATRKLNAQTQKVVREELRQRIPQIRPIRRDMAAATRAVRKAISAEDFDPDALDRALARLRDASARYQVLIHSSLVDLSADLTREERISLAREAIQRAQAVQIPAQQR
ncbi:MAG: periplasmic heavy metal sensor [Pseudomonadota bacterium]